MRKDDLTFLKNFIFSFRTTGALCRTSRKAAHALIAPLHSTTTPADRRVDRSLRVAELGPGTGSVTVELIKALGPRDELVLCEINPDFMKVLKKRVIAMPEYAAHASRIKFVLGAAQELPSHEKFDLVVCCIPFLNLPVEIVSEIFDKIDDISHTGTIITYFEYAGLRTVGRAISPRVREIDRYVRSLFDARRLHTEFVIENVPPINVHTLRALPGQLAA